MHARKRTCLHKCFCLQQLVNCRSACLSPSCFWTSHLHALRPLVLSAINGLHYKCVELCLPFCVDSSMVSVQSSPISVMLQIHRVQLQCIPTQRRSNHALSFAACCSHSSGLLGSCWHFAMPNVWQCLDLLIAASLTLRTACRLSLADHSNLQ